MSGASRREKRSLVTLARDFVVILLALIRAELRSLVKELTTKAKYAGIGIGLFVFAAAIGFFLLGVLVAAAVLALALVFPGWLAALLTAVGLLIVAGIAAVIGIVMVKKAMPLTPSQTIASLKEDIDAIKGMGSYDGD